MNRHWITEHAFTLFDLECRDGYSMVEREIGLQKTVPRYDVSSLRGKNK